MTFGTLTLRNFRSFTHAAFDLSAPRTYLTGLNGSGKSTVIDALAWVLTGRCRGLDAAGRGAAELVHTGAKSAEVTLWVEGVGLVSRAITSAGVKMQVWREETAETFVTDRQEDLLRMLHTSLDRLAIAFDAHAFLDLGHDDAKRLLLGLLDVSFDVSEWADLLDVAPDVASSVTLANLDGLEKRAREQRTIASRRLKEIGAGPALPAAPAVRSRSDLQAEIASIKAGAREAALAASGAQGRLTELRAQEARLAGLAGKRLEQRDAHVARLQAIPNRSAEVVGELSAEQLDALKAQIAADGTELSATEALVAKIAAHSPSSGCVLDPGIPCQTAAKAFGGHVKLLKTTAATLQTRIAESRAAAEVASQARARLLALDEEDRRLRALLDADDRAAQAADDLAGVRARIAEAQQAMPTEDPTAAATKALEPLNAALARWDAYDRAAAAHEAHQATLAKATLTHDRLEDAVQALGPTGLRATVLGQKLDPFVRQVNALLGDYGFTLAIEAHPWKVVVNGRNATLLSVSERLRVGVALQLVICALTGVRFACVDALDLLDRGAGARMARILLERSTKALDTIVMAATREDDAAVPHRDGLSVIRLAPVGEPVHA